MRKKELKRDRPVQILEVAMVSEVVGAESQERVDAD
jgi:hypothetical protein